MILLLFLYRIFGLATLFYFCFGGPLGLWLIRWLYYDQKFFHNGYGYMETYVRRISWFLCLTFLLICYYSYNWY